MPVKSLGSFIAALCVLAVTSFPFLSSPIAHAQGAQPILGYAWSDNIGWIDLNCANTNSCLSVSFGLSSDADGAVSGYAWSDNIGWVSANVVDLVGCPTAPCSATLSSDAFSGWLKALSGGTPQSGGWDGFISLSGASYGVTRNDVALSGFAWASTVVGWVDFSLLIGQCQPVYTCVGNAVHNSCTEVDIPCPPGLICAGGACIPAQGPPSLAIQVMPSLLRQNKTTQVIWSATNVASCMVSEDNPDINDAWTGASDTKTSSSITQRTTYTLSCVRTDGGTATGSATVNVLPVFQEL